MKSFGNALLAGFIALSTCLAGAAGAADYSFTGELLTPNDVPLFDFSIGTASTVTLRTYSYDGGINAAGSEIAPGGFDPMLALFDASGSLLALNDDADPAALPEAIWTAIPDSFFNIALAPGDYRAAILAFGNFPVGLTLAEGFTGNGDFLGRDAHWAFDVLGVNPDQGGVGQVSEPSGLAVLGVGLIGFGAMLRRRP